MPACSASIREVIGRPAGRLDPPYNSMVVLATLVQAILRLIYFTEKKSRPFLNTSCIILQLRKYTDTR